MIYAASHRYWYQVVPWSIKYSRGNVKKYTELCFEEATLRKRITNVCVVGSTEHPCEVYESQSLATTNCISSYLWYKLYEIIFSWFTVVKFVFVANRQHRRYNGPDSPHYIKPIGVWYHQFINCVRNGEAPTLISIHNTGYSSRFHPLVAIWHWWIHKIFHSQCLTMQIILGVLNILCCPPL